MENPQLENGFIRIASELLDAFARYRLSGEERQVVDVIMRKTYGYQKKEDKISLSQFYEATGMKKPSIIRAIHKLLSKNIISKKANDLIPSYSINKLFSTWKPLAKKLIVSKNANTISNIANNRLQKSYPQKIKDNITKDIVSKDTRSNDQYGNKYTQYVLEAFKKRIGAYPIEDNRRNIAYNIYQITGTFIKKYGKQYAAARGTPATFTLLIDKGWDIYLKNNEGTTTRRLKTFKQHYKFMLEKTSEELNKYDKQD